MKHYMSFKLMEDDTYKITWISKCFSFKIDIPSCHNGKLVSAIDDTAFIANKHVRTITIPSSIRSIKTGAFSKLNCLRKIVVLPGNPNYCSYQGVLYDRYMCVLLCFPNNMLKCRYEVPNSVSRIAKNSFYNTKWLKTIYIDPNTHYDSDIFGPTSYYVEVISKFEPDLDLCFDAQMTPMLKYLCKKDKYLKSLEHKLDYNKM